MKNGFINENYDIRRERSKLTRSWVFWYLAVLIALPSFALLVVDRSNFEFWVILAVTVSASAACVAELTTCGRCGTPFFYDPNATNLMGARITMFRRPAKACLGCGLDRE
ncbi:hypothetical protein DMC47_25660 [Nostoc sp. 3335mG]|jgi:hypothetical protein|nr:hypothetical protein DMC47_25660 [Nostoc sp. 3335mG]